MLGDKIPKAFVVFRNYSTSQTEAAGAFLMKSAEPFWNPVVLHKYICKAHLSNEFYAFFSDSKTLGVSLKSKPHCVSAWETGSLILSYPTTGAVAPAPVVGVTNTP